MTNEQKWLLQEMYDEGYRDIKIIGVYAYFVNPTYIDGGNFKVRDNTPRIPCKVLGLSPKTDKYSIGALLGIVEWDKVPVDTKIIVKTLFGEQKLYFAGVGEKGFICCFPCGGTSWSYSGKAMLWSYEEDNARLAENGRD